MQGFTCSQKFSLEKWEKIANFLIQVLGGDSLSPTIFREKGYRFFFFSREEPRIHVHVVCADGEAKYWLEPEVELSKNYNLSPAQLKEIERLIGDHHGEIRRAWEKYFGG